MRGSHCCNIDTMVRERGRERELCFRMLVTGRNFPSQWCIALKSECLCKKCSFTLWDLNTVVTMGNAGEEWCAKNKQKKRSVCLLNDILSIRRRKQIVGWCLLVRWMLACLWWWWFGGGGDADAAAAAFVYARERLSKKLKAYDYVSLWMLKCSSRGGDTFWMPSCVSVCVCVFLSANVCGCVVIFVFVSCLSVFVILCMFLWMFNIRNKKKRKEE